MYKRAPKYSILKPYAAFKESDDEALKSTVWELIPLLKLNCVRQLKNCETPQRVIASPY